MSKEETYQRTLVLAIRTIDDLFYGKYQRDISKLRRVLDCVLNYNLVHWSEANEFVANVTVTAEEYFDREAVNKQTKDGAVQLELQF